MLRLLAVVVVLVVIGLITLAVRTSGSDNRGSGGGAVAQPSVERPWPAAATPAASVPTDPAPTALASTGPAPTEPAPTEAAPTQAAPTESAPSGVPSPALLGLPDFGQHPPLRDVDGWLQSEVTSLEELRGRVVVVQFWTFGCRNCKNTLPNLRELYAGYDRDQVEVVGIHAPEFSFEEDPEAILAAADELGVTWPIVLDTRKRTFHDWQAGTRAYWPRTYVLDQQGHIRFDHIGEGAYDELNRAVAMLVDQPAT